MIEAGRVGRRREKVKPVQPLVTQAPAAAAEVPCGTTWRVHNKAGFALDEARLPSCDSCRVAKASKVFKNHLSVYSNCQAHPPTITQTHSLSLARDNKSRTTSSAAFFWSQCGYG